MGTGRDGAISENSFLSRREIEAKFQKIVALFGSNMALCNMCLIIVLTRLYLSYMKSMYGVTNVNTESS